MLLFRRSIVVFAQQSAYSDSKAEGDVFVVDVESEWRQDSASNGVFVHTILFAVMTLVQRMAFVLQSQ